MQVSADEDYRGKYFAGVTKAAEICMKDL